MFVSLLFYRQRFSGICVWVPGPALKRGLSGVLGAIGVGVVLAASSAAQAGPPIEFRTQVAPLLETHCARCHSGEHPEGELSLTTPQGLTDGGYLQPGRPEASRLVEVLTSRDGGRPAMPKEGRALTAAEVTVIRQWVAEGARWPPGVVLRRQTTPREPLWSLTPIREPHLPSHAELDAAVRAAASVNPPAQPLPPALAPGTWCRNPIDAFIYRRLAEAGLRPSPPADRRTLIRRLSFDLLGLPPTYEQVQTFVEDADPLAYERLVDQLLASPRYGERWARHWLDIAHYADTHGFERDQRRDNAYRYRDWVIRAWNSDMPFDQFVRLQIAGDVVAPGDPQAQIATGFLAAGPWDFVGQVETKSPVLRRAARADDLDDMVTQVITSTLGLTINCARCHDHKLDPISQQDYYQLWAVFAGVHRSDRPVSAEMTADYEARRERLADKLNEVRFQLGQLRGTPLDLADLVGGGNGYGTGTRGHGLDPRTAKQQTRPFGFLGNVRANTFAPAKLPFVDGVFIPDGNAPQPLVISSTGLTFAQVPATSARAWDAIRNGPVANQDITQLNGVDYASEGHRLLGLHANAGITFDLQAIRAATRQGGYELRAAVGYGGDSETGKADFHVLLDGKLARQRLGLTRDAGEFALRLTIGPEVRFLTLVATDGGNGIGYDQIFLGDPHLILQPGAEASRAASKAENSKAENSKAENSKAEDSEAENRANAADDPQRNHQLERLQRHERELLEALESLGPVPRVYAVESGQPPPVHRLVRGNPETPAEQVSPGGIAALGVLQAAFDAAPAELAEGRRRAVLADALTNPENPLTPRVIVNRLWHHHFGRGLVATPSDFGNGGSRPTHPQLLDYLSRELLRGNWSLKQVQRLIVTSQTYRQSSVSAHSRGPRLDAENRWLWRMSPRQLDAESLRDSVLAVTGSLNGAMYGPGYEDFHYREEYAPVYTYLPANRPALWRRSIYRFIVRSTPHRFMTTLDCPNPANLTPVRNRTTTPLQSLALLNNAFMLDQSKRFAERLGGASRRDGGGDAACPASLRAAVRHAFQLAFARDPSRGEVEAAATLAAEHGLFAVCRALLNANEFVHVD